MTSPVATLPPTRVWGIKLTDDANDEKTNSTQLLRMSLWPVQSSPSKQNSNEQATTKLQVCQVCRQAVEYSPQWMLALARRALGLRGKSLTLYKSGIVNFQYGGGYETIVLVDMTKKNPNDDETDKGDHKEIDVQALQAAKTILIQSVVAPVTTEESLETSLARPETYGVNNFVDPMHDHTLGFNSHEVRIYLHPSEGFTPRLGNWAEDLDRKHIFSLHTAGNKEPFRLIGVERATALERKLAQADMSHDSSVDKPSRKKEDKPSASDTAIALSSKAKSREKATSTSEGAKKVTSSKKDDSKKSENPKKSAPSKKRKSDESDDTESNAESTKAKKAASSTKKFKKEIYVESKSDSSVEVEKKKKKSSSSGSKQKKANKESTKEKNVSSKKSASTKKDNGDDDESMDSSNRPPAVKAPSKKEKSAKKKKDPNAPKNALSAYTLFMTENLPSVKAKMAGDDIKQGDIMKECARQWKARSEDVNHKYVKLAEKERERYKAEMEAYNKKIKEL